MAQDLLKRIRLTRNRLRSLPVHPTLLVQVGARHRDKTAAVLDPVRLRLHPLDVRKDVRHVVCTAQSCPFVQALLLGDLAATSRPSSPELREASGSNVGSLAYTVPYAIGNIVLTIWGPVVVAIVHAMRGTP